MDVFCDIMLSHDGNVCVRLLMNGWCWAMSFPSWSTASHTSVTRVNHFSFKLRPTSFNWCLLVLLRYQFIFVVTLVITIFTFSDSVLLQYVAVWSYITEEPDSTEKPLCIFFLSTVPCNVIKILHLPGYFFIFWILCFVPKPLFCCTWHPQNVLTISFYMLPCVRLMVFFMVQLSRYIY